MESTDPIATAATILGISCDFHDAAAGLVIDGRIVAAAEEERFSRVKHDGSLPIRSVDAVLRTAGLGADDIDLIVFYEKPLDVVGRFLASKQRQGPRGLGSFVRDMPILITRNLMIGQRLATMMRSLGATRRIPVRYLEHHRSHAAAAFFPSPFDHAAILTVDGIGEWATASIGVGRHHRIESLEELRYPDSLGLLYSFVTAYCGFRPNSDEYKLMGLAPYGQARFRAELEELIDLETDGSVRVAADRLGWYSTRGLRRRGLHRLLGGPPRDPGQPTGQREADLAASVQSLLETSILRMADHAHRLTGETDLVMAGGVALNCVANGRLLRESPFQRIWIQPAAGDAGSAVGAALGWWHDVAGRPRTPVRPDAMAGSFLGPAAAPAEVDAWVATTGIRSERFDDRRRLVEEVARRLAVGEVVGWFCGRMEFGPRALGHRSLLADPRRPEVRTRLNAVVKGREDFRPFAPAVLAEHAGEWFDLDAMSPYMLVVASVAADHLVDVDDRGAGVVERSETPRSAIPACTHVDGSARVQTVARETNPEFHGLLSAFHELTGCPVLLNTSFNLAGEPIVATPPEALDTARRGGIDALVVEHHVIDADAWSADPSSELTVRAGS